MLCKFCQSVRFGSFTPSNGTIWSTSSAGASLHTSHTGHSVLFILLIRSHSPPYPRDCFEPRCCSRCLALCSLLNTRGDDGIYYFPCICDATRMAHCSAILQLPSVWWSFVLPYHTPTICTIHTSTPCTSSKQSTASVLPVLLTNFTVTIPHPAPAVPPDNVNEAPLFAAIT